MTSSSLGIRFTDRERLIGFGFMDIVDGQNDLYPRVANLKPSGRGWVDFTRSIRAITLLRKGFGEIIKPTKDSNKLWQVLESRTDRKGLPCGMHRHLERDLYEVWRLRR
jgi:hypothetical protein